MNLTDKQIQWLQWLVLVAIIGVFGFLNRPAPFPVPPTPQANVLGASNIKWTAPDNATLEGLSGATFKTDSGSTMTIASGTTETHANNPAFSAFLVFTPATTISVTNGSPITPTATFQPLSSSGTVTATTISTASVASGTLLRMINTSATSIVLTNGTYVKLPSASNLTLGQYDTVYFMFDGTEWVTAATSNN